MNNIENEIKRLNFENIIWIIFIILSILNIIVDDYQKQYIITNNKKYEKNANNISLLVSIILLLIYIYFFIRNNQKTNKRDIDKVKTFGSIFFILGTLCLLYFQINNQDDFPE